MKVLYHYRKKDSSRNFSSSNSLEIVPLVSITNAGKLLQEIEKQLPVKRRENSATTSICLSNQNKALASGNEGERVFLGLGYFWFSINIR